MKILYNRTLWLICGIWLISLTVNAQSDPKLVLESQGHSARIWDVAFTPNGRNLITVSDDKSIRIWNTSTGELKRTLRGQIGDGSEGKMYALALSRDGRYLAVGGFLSYKGRGSGNIRIIDLKSNRQIATLRGHTNVVHSLSFSRDGKYLASGSSDRKVRVWNIATRKSVATLKGHTKAVYGVSLSGSILVSGSYDKTVKVWDWRSNQMLKTITKHTGKVQTVRFSPNGRFFATGSYDGKTLLFDATGNFLKEISTIDATVKKVRFSSDSKKLAVIGTYQTIFSIPSGRQIRQITKHKYARAAAFWGATGKYLATAGGNDKEIYIWNTQTGKSVTYIKGMGKIKYNVGFVKSKDGGVKIAFGNKWGGRNGKGALTQAFDFKTLQLYTHDIDPSEFRKTLTVYKDNTLTRSSSYRLKVTDELTIKNSSSVDGSVESFTYTPNAYRIVLGNTFKMNLYSRKGKKLRQLIGHTARVGSVSPASDNKLVVSGSYDQTINIWNLDEKPYSNSRKKLQSVAEVYTHKSWPAVWKKVGVSDQVNTPTFEAWWNVVKALRENRRNIDANLYEAYLNRKLSLKSLPLVSLFVATDGEWVCWTPQGYYAASAGGERYIGWHINQGINSLGKFYPVSTFRKKYYKPELVKLIVKYRSFEKALQAYNNSSKVKQTEEKIVKKNENILDHLPPKIEWLNPTEGDLQVDGKAYTIKARITSNSKITGVKLLVNGRAVAKTRGFEVVKAKSDKEKLLEYKVSLDNPETNLLVFASNTSSSALSDGRILKRKDNGNRGNENKDDDLNFDVKTSSMLKPNLYVVSVGVSNFKKQSYNLDYAHVDAKSMAGLFKQQKGLLYKDVQVKELTNEQATRANILDAFYWLEKNVTHKDVAILFIASHGFNEKGKFYILPHDGDPDRLRSTAVNWADFQDVLGNLPSKVMLFLDACHSGALGNNLMKTRGAINNTEAIREITSAEHGVVVMSAATGNESSLEHPDWKHGAFTYALLKAMDQKKADFNSDGIVYLRELDFFVADEVKTLTKGKQHPTTLKPSTISRLPILQVRK
ncbi:hypothetical protein BKI52_19150 [marine bacterium AO1-C]|nr:hypothetical protein BKI52_19150 [marine bacterium AO1-C]